jgi:serine/threonine-protein kinase
VRPVGSKYLLEEPIGRGATGTVWRARVREDIAAPASADGAEGASSQPGDVVAIKVLKEELASDPDIVMRFLRERSVLLRLTHPNIVRTRDLVVEGELLALVMDLVNGPDLHRYVRDNGPFTPMAAALLAAAIADALAASHADGIVHRDLKPANVLLASSEDGLQMHPMLTDFGIARLADSPGVTRTHEFVGTPAYVAPESAEGREQTSAVDIYGAGILMYELVTGEPPFRGESALEVLHQHLSQEPRRPSTVPDPLWTVIERCLRKNPEERPSAESLARALRVVGQGVGAHATPQAAEAALGVAGLLASDPAPARVSGTGAAATAVAGTAGGTPRRQGDMGGADPTQVMPSGSHAAIGAYDPAAATSALPNPVPDATRVIPSEPQGPQAPSHPHPWESQLSAARHRNQQTEIGYLDPSQDPLRHRPRRQPQPQPSPQPRPQAAPAAPARQQYGSPQPRPRPRPEPQPERYEPQRRTEREPAPAPRRERSPRAPMRIPGLGCLKGCLFMIFIVVVIFILVWNFTPVPHWIAQGENWYQATSSWISSAYHWVSTIGNASKGMHIPKNGSFG